MITFHPSPTFVDLVINHPTVRPTFQLGAHRLSSEDRLHQPGFKALATEGMVALFEPAEQGQYIGHICAIAGSRGAKALRFGTQALKWLFDDPTVRILTAPVARQLPAARVYCIRLGLRHVGRDLFQDYFSMERDQWAV